MPITSNSEVDGLLYRTILSGSRHQRVTLLSSAKEEIGFPTYNKQMIFD